MDNQDRRRGHFHRGRRGPDRRGLERRNPPPPGQEPTGRDHVDVEQIMRDVRARIAQRSGIELSTQQIQELAARRLEAVLDPRTIKPGLLDEMRKAASGPAGRQGQDAPIEPAYSFDEATIYESHRGVMRFFRRLFSPLLKLLFNPSPIAKALHIQSRLNVEAAQREAERERRQTEWNALHYEIVQRLVTEVSRVSIEVQAMSTRIESLSAKVDFNERRVRGVEGAMHQVRPSGRPAEIQVAASVPSAESAPQPEPGPTPAVEGAQPPSGEAARRRRRRRRGRRGGGMPGEAAGFPAAARAPSAQETMSPSPLAETDLGPDAEPEVAGEIDVREPDAALYTAAEGDVPPATTEGEVLVQPEPREETAAPTEPSSPPPATWEPPPTPTEE